MESKGDRTVNGIPRWACPWAPGWSGMHQNSPQNSERELLLWSQRYREERTRAQALPKNSQRRIQRIGFAATGVAATVWLLAMVWVWQIIT